MFGSIKKVEVLDYPEDGMEAVWKIEVEDFPAFIVVDNKARCPPIVSCYRPAFLPPAKQLARIFAERAMLRRETIFSRSGVSKSRSDRANCGQLYSCSIVLIFKEWSQ